MDQHQPIITVENASKRYVKYADSPMLLHRLLDIRARTVRSELLAVREASFTIAAGESVGVIGRNGSGKSTLLRMLAGVTAPTKGRVMVCGRIAPLLAVGVGFHPELTGRENVYISGSILGMTRSAIDERFDEIIEFADLGDFVDTPVKFYSSGMFVRLGFGVSIIAQPDVLLVDEVLAVGDIGFQLKCFDRMTELQALGTTIVVVSHNLNAIRRMCPRTLVLHDGVIRHDGNTLEAIALFHDLLGEPREIEDGGPTERGKEPSGQRAIVESIELLDSQRRPIRHMTVGETATLVVRLRALDEITDALLGAAVFNAAGVQVYGDSSDWTTPFRLSSGACASLEMRFTAHLATGSYTAHAGLVGRDGTVLSPQSIELLFYVDGRARVSGVADLGATFALHIDSDDA